VTTSNRREFLQDLAKVAGAIVLVPAVTPVVFGQDSKPAVPVGGPIPSAPPKGWDPIAFNKKRGNAGAIPESYHASINGKDGPKKHLGKHLPYQPALDAKLVPGGFLAIMWGDPKKGYAKHPNAAKSAKKPAGHWYNWVRISKVGGGEELQSNYTSWPGTAKGDTGAYAVSGDGKITEDGGRNTVYLAALPKGVKKGDTIRIYAHCLTHGEWVDFMTVA